MGSGPTQSTGTLLAAVDRDRAPGTTGQEQPPIDTPGNLVDAGQTNIDLAVDVVPLLCCPQPAHELFEGGVMLRCVFEPGQEVEGLSELATVVQAPGDGGQVLQA